MGVFKYKGYSGSVEYSEKDDCLFGRVLGMNKDCISYEGQTLDELRRDFEGAVDDYLLMCKSKGITPQKPYSGTLNIRISPETHGKIAEIAMIRGITINGFIRSALENATAKI